MKHGYSRGAAVFIHQCNVAVTKSDTYQNMQLNCWQLTVFIGQLHSGLKRTTEILWQLCSLSTSVSSLKWMDGFECLFPFRLLPCSCGRQLRCVYYKKASYIIDKFHVCKAEVETLIKGLKQKDVSRVSLYSSVIRYTGKLVHIQQQFGHSFSFK